MLAAMRTRSSTRCLALSLILTLAAAPTTRAASPMTTANPAVAPRDSVAEAAYSAAVELVKRQDYDHAVQKLDIAAELAPEWSTPLRLRAEVFSMLAERHRPSETFMLARAADLQRLLALEPGVDTEARLHEIAVLRQQSVAASKLEHRRRKLSTPALIFGTATASLVIAGAMLYALKPNDALKPSALHYERRDTIGLAMMIAGAALVPPAIVLGVLAGRQARRDSAVRDFNIETGRPRAALGMSPQFVPGGGGLGLNMRF